MNIQPSFETFCRCAQQGNLIPVYADFLGDRDTPVSAYAKLRSAGPAFLFESVDGGETLSRYSFVGTQPRKIIAAGPETTEIREVGHSPVFTTTPEDPLTLVEEEISRYKPVELPDMPPFFGGAVGFCGYEYIHRIEPSVRPVETDAYGIPILYYIFTDTVVIFDRARQTLRICACARLVDGADPRAAYEAAVASIRGIAAGLALQNPIPPTRLAEAPLPATIPEGNFRRDEFESAVERVKEYIRAGDIIQGVLSQRFSHPFPRSAIHLYRALRTVNPSPYMFLFETDEFALVGASPEVHVRLTGDRVEIKPIAGTRPRGRNADEDRAMEAELLADEKERAEHLMLVDLARNDIGRVCRTGSVSVENFMHVDRYSHVMHIVSDVSGTIRPDCNAFDLLRATFPAGTISGAPKIRAMQIVNELEPVQRGPYSGALGYFSYDGNHDSCIAIRTAVLENGKIHIQAGAGIVADSDPAAEYEETVNKAKGLFKAVILAESLD